MRGGAGELAHTLLEQGVTGMKMWPFDDAAVASGGYDISNADLDAGLAQRPDALVRRTTR
jgi:galactonate dehydratase